MYLPLANILGAPENVILLGLLALLLFGKRLPEVGRSLGKGIIEFKKGLAGVEEDVTNAGQQATSNPPPAPRTALPPAYKFDPYTGKALNEPEPTPQMRFDPYTGKPLSEQPASQSTSLDI